MFFAVSKLRLISHQLEIKVLTPLNDAKENEVMKKNHMFT